jgi:TrmH family RNA methyltransferase
VGADEKGSAELDTHDFGPPTVVVLGNEARGLGQAYQQMCDRLVRIPMSGSASSLNVSVAASIILYEAARQRRAAST